MGGRCRRSCRWTERCGTTATGGQVPGSSDDGRMTPEHRRALERLRAGWGRMEGRSVLVTGATRGIGLETAVRLAELGADVLVHGRDAGRGAAALAAVRGASAPDLPAPASPALYLADLSSVAEVRRLAAAVLRDRPRLDVLVANAGVYSPVRSQSRRWPRAHLRRQRRRAAPARRRAAAGAPLGGVGADRRRQLGFALDRRDRTGTTCSSPVPAPTTASAPTTSPSSPGSC